MLSYLGNPSAGHRLCRLLERGRRRTRQDQIAPARVADEIADIEIRTERRKLVSSAGPVLGKSELLSENTIQPFDLMSRRHPLSSTRAVN
jgi:hypothetical protein